MYQSINVLVLLSTHFIDPCSWGGADYTAWAMKGFCLPVEHRAKLSRAKLYWKIRRNTKHPLHTKINRRRRNGWTTEIQECHRLVSRQLEEPTQLQRHATTPWKPYECRIDWTLEGVNVNTETEITRIHPPDDNTYYTAGSSDGTHVDAAVVHKEEEIIIRLNDSASVLDAEMTAIRVALENASETRDKITIRTVSLTAVNILNNKKLDLNTITRAIRDAATRLTQRPTINWNTGCRDCGLGSKERLTT